MKKPSVQGGCLEVKCWSEFLFIGYPVGIPDFAEVYGFIGSVFDPDSKEHVNKLKEMDPINFETVSLRICNCVVDLYYRL